MAGPTGLVNTVSGGYDPRPGFEREFVTYIWLEGGWGGRPAKKDNHTSMCLFATSATNQPMEQQERLFPLMFDAYRLEPDSFGAGRHRGAPGRHEDLALHPRRRRLLEPRRRRALRPLGLRGRQGRPRRRIVYAPGTRRGAEPRHVLHRRHASSATGRSSSSTPAAAASATRSSGRRNGCSRTSRTSSSRRAAAERDFGVVVTAGDAAVAIRTRRGGDRGAPCEAPARKPGDVTRVLVTGAGGHRQGRRADLPPAARSSLPATFGPQTASSRPMSRAMPTSRASSVLRLRWIGCVNAFGAEGPVGPSRGARPGRPYARSWS